MSACHVPNDWDKQEDTWELPLGDSLRIGGCCLKWQLGSTLLSVPSAVGFSFMVSLSSGVF